MKDNFIVVPPVGDIYSVRMDSVVDGANEFCKMNKLKYKFKKSQGSKSLDILARDGYLIVRHNGNNMVLVYLPEVVSNNQMKWLDDNKNELKKINTVGVFNYKNGKPENLMSVIELVKEAKSKNNKYIGK